ncbi:unnamed protein product, partial [Allacma fusca]
CLPLGIDNWRIISQKDTCAIAGRRSFYK